MRTLRFPKLYSTYFNPQKHIEQVKKHSIDFPKDISFFNNDKVFLKQLSLLNNYEFIRTDLEKFNEKLLTDYFNYHIECNLNEPILKKYDACGNEINEIITCNAWKKLKSLSAVEGLVAIPYENDFKEESRIYQGLKLVMFTPFSGLYTCPLAMTDGAAYIIKNLKHKTITELNKTYKNLISRDPNIFWTSGQWMTEKKGGSDVAQSTDTVAIPTDNDNIFRLYGYKWFSSATDSDMALTLARSLDSQNGQIIQGNRGLSLYYVETKASCLETGPIPSSGLNFIEIINLKDKLGTRQLPTAELVLNGTRALQISEVGRGIASISGMLTITRIHNAISAVGYMRHLFLMAREYSHVRYAFGDPIISKALHAKTLVQLDVESRAGFYLVMDVLKYLGRLENQDVADDNEEDEAMLRILSPLLKLYTGKQAMSVISEALESFGGIGYLEDSGLPVFLRDAQVLTIWEGTTNILSLDLLRALSKSSNSLNTFYSNCIKRLQLARSLSNKEIQQQAVITITTSLDIILKFVLENQDNLEIYSRQLSYALSRIYMGILLLEISTEKSADLSDKNSLAIWLNKDLTCGLSKRGLETESIDWVKHLKGEY